ncbi:MAG: UPF0280 family protein [Desulfonauticus sp.]|nr:UPF0280 family protein [Desulfonauticus sp.]
MKPYLSPFRTYRKFVLHKDEVQFQVVVEETDLFIIAETNLKQEIINYTNYLRSQIKSYIEIHPNFLTSLKPLPFDPKAPPIVQEMLLASSLFEVGPMAAVAGSIAEAIAKKFSSMSKNLIIENGGDIYIYSTQPRIIGLLSNPKENITLGLKLTPKQFPCAVCTSSGKIGHSLSFGKGDLAVVVSQSGAKADAAATFFSNLLISKKDLTPVLKQAQKLKSKGIDGIFLQFNELIGAWGEIEIVSV